MNAPNSIGAPAGGGGGNDELSNLFAQLVMQQANMAMMLLGHVAHPETGQVVRDLEAAKQFIDQLEMLQAKTKGNLTREEAGLLQQSLTTLRLSFVEAVEAPPPSAAKQPVAAAGQAKTGESTAGTPGQPSTPDSGEEHRPKFTKKY